MPANARVTLSRQLLALALLAVLAATSWAVRTAPTENSDRYDYLGRAYHVLEGQGARPLLIYPLRLAFDGALQLPAENLTRPPLWPTLIAPALRLGAGDVAGVLTAAVGLLALVSLVYIAANRSFGAPAGGIASLVLATSFATSRGLLGGGPELWVALLLMVAWTWNGVSRAGPYVLGSVLGLLPWLHPVGWLYMGMGLASRVWRSSGRAMALAGFIAIVLGSFWYLQVGKVTGNFASPLQSQAELAKALQDAGGLGPYLTLEPTSSLEVLRSNPGGVLKNAAHNLRELLQGLDGWMAWPFVLAGLLGIPRDRQLALRDLGLIGLAFGVVAFVASDPRLLLPCLPIAAIWSGAGLANLSDRVPAWAIIVVISGLSIAPWVMPLGLVSAPHRGPDLAPDVPSLSLVQEVGLSGVVGTPFVTDSAELAWRSRRVGMFVPESPSVLEAILKAPAMRSASVLVLRQGRESRWLSSSREEWGLWLESRELRSLGPSSSTLAVDLRSETITVNELFVPEPLSLMADDPPGLLTSIPVPPATREGMELDAPALAALLPLLQAAQADGIVIRVTSAYRPYERQRQLFERAVERHGGEQQWVARPGSSEHQLGTTVDFCDDAMQHVLEQSFETTEAGIWLAANAVHFGWVRSYTTENEHLSGYKPEPWHFRWYGDDLPSTILRSQ